MEEIFIEAFLQGVANIKGVKPTKEQRDSVARMLREVLEKGDNSAIQMERIRKNAELEWRKILDITGYGDQPVTRN